MGNRHVFLARGKKIHAPSYRHVIVFHDLGIILQLTALPGVDRKLRERQRHLDTHLRGRRGQLSEPRIPHKIRGGSMGNHVAAHDGERLHLGRAEKYFDVPNFEAATELNNVKVKGLPKDGMHAMGLGRTHKKAEGQPRVSLFLGGGRGKGGREDGRGKNDCVFVRIWFVIDA